MAFPYFSLYFNLPLRQHSILKALQFETIDSKQMWQFISRRHNPMRFLLFCSLDERVTTRPVRLLTSIGNINLFFSARVTPSSLIDALQAEPFIEINYNLIQISIRINVHFIQSVNPEWYSRHSSSISNKRAKWKRFLNKYWITKFMFGEKKTFFPLSFK